MATVGPIEALGTVWYIECFSDADTDLLHTETVDFLDQFEQKYSRFRPDSLLSELNSKQVLKDPDPEFVELLKLSLQYYQETNGVFTIAIGEAMNASGYDANYSLEATETVETPDLDEILEVTDQKVTLLNGSLDLGGIGKGFCIDKLAEHYQITLGMDEFLINGGGDMYGTHQEGKPIEIKLAHPTAANQVIGSAKLFNQGFASSSPHIRSWKDAKTGEEQNHLLTKNKITSYVVAESATEADVWATALALESGRTNSHSTSVMILEADSVLFCDDIFSLNKKLPIAG